MNNRFLIIIIALAFCPLSIYAAPYLAFSDIVSGPDTGIGDGLGSGAIITVWGNNLGTSQGSNKIYFTDSASQKREAAYVYYWCSANGSSGGPANLSKLGLQEIAFSIPDGATGAGTISVTVGGVESNTLPFTVRTGNIYHIKTTGNDSTGNGSWSTPWLTPEHIVQDANAHLAAGDIIYIGNGVTCSSGISIGSVSGKDGTADSPISLVSYPGAVVNIDYPSGGYGPIRNYNTEWHYWNFAKLKCSSVAYGIASFEGSRVVANYITGPNSDSQGGAISGSGLVAPASRCTSDMKVLGNEIYDWGASNCSNLHHGIYLSNRSDALWNAFEIGYNYLHDNKCNRGIHPYDEGVGGSYSGVIKIHHNWVENQVSAGLDITAGGTTGDDCFTDPIWVYDNVFVNIGLPNAADSFLKWGIVIRGYRIKSDVLFYNNTIYGYCYGTTGDRGLLAIYNSGADNEYDFQGTWQWINNIVVDTNDQPYIYSTWDWSHKLTAANNNLWYNGGDSNPSAPPTWDTTPLTSNPLFISSSDFSLQSASPCKDTGADLSSTFTIDFLGAIRGTSWDMGAFEYATSPSISGGVTLSNCSVH